MNKTITKYSLFLLLFLLFHLLTWRLINIFELSYTINFLIQFFVFSVFAYYFRLINFEIIFISIPALILYLMSVIAYIDRSLTVEMLDYYIEKEEISVQDIYKLEKLSSKYLIEKRLEEQQNSGLIKINEDNLQLTSRGKFIGLVYKYLGILYQN
tara:strand:- start:3507 stop:3971 length:465 start_codon:yes stop_codon:yes gene_type:complete